MEDSFAETPKGKGRRNSEVRRPVSVKPWRSPYADATIKANKSVGPKKTRKFIAQFLRFELLFNFFL
jgi:hypothetical protein